MGRPYTMKSNITGGAGSRVAAAAAGQMLPAVEPARNKPNKARYTTKVVGQVAE